MGTKRTNIYIDGFNLYYRSLKNTPFKWLDLKSLLLKLLPNDYFIETIKYFTAPVSALDDPQRPLRQNTYIRALETYIPEIKVYYGKFLSHPTMMPLANPDYPQKSKDLRLLDAQGNPVFKRVVRTDEKGSDVNMAIHILNDAWLNKYDCAVLVSNDSDIAGALSFVKENHPTKEIGLIIPFEWPSSQKNRRASPSVELMKRADFKRQIRKGVLRSSQLPQQIPNTNIHKPLSW